MSSEEIAILNAYQRLMIEVENRLELVLETLDGKLPVPSIAARELSYLQLRLVCECISVACVIAHDGLSDINAGRLKAEYAAYKMAHMLEKLHDRFYPHPTLITEVSPGHKQMIDRECDFLEKDDLQKLYRKCGDILHRGTPASFLAGSTIDANWQPEVREHVIKIINLLASHATVMKGDEKVIFYDGINHRAVAANALLDLENAPSASPLESPTSGN